MLNAFPVRIVLSLVGLQGRINNVVGEAGAFLRVVLSMEVIPYFILYSAMFVHMHLHGDIDDGIETRIQENTVHGG